MNFRQFQDKLRKCRICKNVVGPPLVWGDEKARIVQISQAPSQTAIRNQKVWTDASGRRLKYDWYQVSNEVFYNPRNFYITALSHCFPGKDKKGGDKKPPKVCAQRWLWKEISYLKPRLFIVIGKQAAEFLFPKRDFRQLVFKDQKLNGVKCLILPHPSPVNIKWFRDNPEFEKKRLPEAREIIHKVLF